MAISTSAVGLALGQRERELSTRSMLAYAAGLGELSPQVFDDLDPGFMAHPALCVALEWPLLSHPAAQAALVPDAHERQRAVHLIQDSQFHRPMRSGDRLRTTGRVTGIWRGSAGVRLASSLHTCTDDGTPVVTSHTVALYRGVAAIGEDHPPPQRPEPPMKDADWSQEHSVELPTDRALPHRYTECSGIWNPIHTERRVALAAGLPDVVLHGTATWALAGSAIVRQLAGGDAARLKRLRGRFGALVFPGSTLQLRWRARDCGHATEVQFTVLTTDGQPAIADGLALLA